MRRRPNVIICLCDQLRAFEVGCYGNRVIRTPHLDTLAAGGVRFETAVTNFPVCMAARSVILSGQYNRTCTGGVSNVGVPTFPDGNNMPEYPFSGRPHLKEQTLPEILQAHGYRTSAIGKWHIHSWPQDIGFQQYLIPRVHHCYTGQHYTENGGPEFAIPGYSVDYEAERVEDFLKEQLTRTEPFFLFYNISPPHCPMSDAPAKYTEMHNPDEVPVRPNVDLSRPLPDQEYAFKVYRWDYRYYNFHLPYTEELPADYNIRNIIALYYGMTAWVDDQVGRMIAALRSAGLENDTLIIFTSDHGDNLGSHGRVQKNSPNEEAIRIPLIMCGPKIESPDLIVTDRIASLVDLAPTILAMLGINVPDHMHGCSLLNLSGNTTLCGGTRPVIVEMSGGIAVRSLTHKLVVPYVERGKTLADSPSEFYDLRQDPYELNNLAGTEQSLPEAAELLSYLQEWDMQIPWMANRK